MESLNFFQFTQFALDEKKNLRITTITKVIAECRQVCSCICNNTKVDVLEKIDLNG